MPRIPNHPCAYPGCPALVPRGTKYCDAHAGEHRDATRSTFGMGYDKRWERERKRFLAMHPLCEACKANGRYVKATDVDHVVPHRGDKRLFWDRSNWQALCHSCHSRKTAREDMRVTYHY